MDLVLIVDRLAFAGFRERWHAYAVIPKDILE